MAVNSGKPIGIMASAGGTTFEAARMEDLRGQMDATVAFVVSNNPANKAHVWRRASVLGLGNHTYHVNNIRYPDTTLPPRGVMTTAAAAEVLRLARDVYGVKMIATLGFMKKVVAPLLGGLPVANTHPGILPETAGLMGDEASKKVLEEGMDETGVTFYWMDPRPQADGLPAYDVGETIGFAPVPVLDRHRKEYETDGTAEKLFADVQRIEKVNIPLWIDKAYEQL
jgi:folate-dependent phosphoribosylglycinamide formyltransferase PurN